jgi:hypothetical protein
VGPDVPEGEPRLDGHVISDKHRGGLSASWWITTPFARRMVEEKKAVPVTMPSTARLPLYA